MKKASTRLLEQETQTPSPAPDLIPAESSTENLHWDWYSKRGHFNAVLTYPWPNQLDIRVQGRFHVFLCLFKIASPDGERQLRTIAPPTIIFRPEKALKGYRN